MFLSIEIFHILDKYFSTSSSSGLPSFISDIKSATNSVKSAIEEVNNILGIEINKVIASVPPEGCKFDILSGDCDVDDYNEISGKDVSNVLLSALKNHDFEDYELILSKNELWTLESKQEILNDSEIKIIRKNADEFLHNIITEFNFNFDEGYLVIENINEIYGSFL